MRKTVLARDKYLCQIGLPGICTVHATCVDHIRAIAEGGAHLDPANLRAACKPCNRKLGQRLGAKKLAMSQNRWSRAW